MSELRNRMIRDMPVRGFSPRTHEAYIAAVVHLAKHYHRAPDLLTNDEVQAYLAHLIQERHLSWSTCAQAAHAFRFLYHVTLGHPRADFHVPAPKQPQRLPTSSAARKSGGCSTPARSPAIGSFHTVAATLTTFARDPRHLGGQLGGTAILHTWGQPLVQHLHLHCVVPGGALAQVFRAKFLDGLHRAFSAGTLTFAGALAPLAEPPAFTAWLAQFRQHDWVVYAKPPFAGPTHVLEYLGRYTHRVALSNDRLLSVEQGVVRFRWKDYADADRVKVMALDVDEFIRRFLLHVVPDRFVRIRHFGFLANRTRQAKLARCRQLLAQPPAPAVRPRESVQALMLRLTGRDIAVCPVCQRGHLRVTAILPPSAHPPGPSPSGTPRDALAPRPPGPGPDHAPPVCPPVCPDALRPRPRVS